MRPVLNASGSALRSVGRVASQLLPSPNGDSSWTETIGFKPV